MKKKSEFASDSIIVLLGNLLTDNTFEEIKSITNIIDKWFLIIEWISKLSLKKNNAFITSCTKPHFLLNILNIVFNEDPRDCFETLNYEGYKCFIQTIKTEVITQHYEKLVAIIKALVANKISKDMLYSSIMLFIKNMIIRKSIKYNIKKDRNVKDLLEWFHNKPLKYFNFLLTTNSKNSKNTNDTLAASYTAQLIKYVHRCYFLLNIKSILHMLQTSDEDILKELGLCIPYLNKNELMNVIKTTTSSELTSISYSTMDFITIFISLNTLCNNWDTSGELFNHVSQDLKQYLKTRSDVIPCLVRKVTSEYNSIQIPQNEAYENLQIHINEDIDEEDKTQLEQNRYKSNSSILTSILQVYGTSNEFLEEYCSQLAMRLLNMTSKEELEFENEQIELIKKYFGNSQTQKCSIMMNDFKKSIEINQVILNNQLFKHSTIDFEVQLITPLIWDVPMISNLVDHFQIPDEIQKLINEYEHGYKIHKEMRQLEWLNHLSMVEIEVKWKNDDITHNIWCNAFYAILLEQFSNGVCCNVEMLSSKLNASYDKVRNGLIYWQRKGMIIKSSIITHQDDNYYQLVNSYDDINQKSTQSHSNNNNQYDNHNIGGRGDDLTKLKTYEEKIMEELENETWPFIEGMLTNLGSMSIDKIYSSLKMFAFNQKDPPFTIEQLKNYLNSKIKSSHLFLEHNNNYTIRNNN